MPINLILICKRFFKELSFIDSLYNKKEDKQSCVCKTEKE